MLLGGAKKLLVCLLVPSERFLHALNNALVYLGGGVLKLVLAQAFLEQGERCLEAGLPLWVGLIFVRSQFNTSLVEFENDPV